MHRQTDLGSFRFGFNYLSSMDLSFLNGKIDISYSPGWDIGRIQENIYKDLTQYQIHGWDSINEQQQHQWPYFLRRSSTQRNRGPRVLLTSLGQSFPKSVLSLLLVPDINSFLGKKNAVGQLIWSHKF